MLLNGENVSKEIRKEEVGKMASATSVYKEVRTKLVELQQKLAADRRCYHGWKRYRNLCAAECPGKDLS
ncbi:MAG: (d)CMP kinase [Roseburia sp.]